MKLVRMEDVTTNQDFQLDRVMIYFIEAAC